MSDHLSLIGLLIICSMEIVFSTTTKSLIVSHNYKLYIHFGHFKATKSLNRLSHLLEAFQT